MKEWGTDDEEEQGAFAFWVEATLIGVLVFGGGVIWRIVSLFIPA